MDQSVWARKDGLLAGLRRPWELVMDDFPWEARAALYLEESSRPDELGSLRSCVLLWRDLDEAARARAVILTEEDVVIDLIERETKRLRAGEIAILSEALADRPADG